MERTDVATPEHDPLATIRDDWIRDGLSTVPADRTKAELGAWEAFQSIGASVPQLLIWVQSPMAGVLASTYVGFAIGEPMKPRLMAATNAALARIDNGANEIQCAVDARVWHAVRAAVHRQVAAELHTRDAAWSQMKRDIGNFTWGQVWEEVGDQIYAQSWESEARAADGLFEENLLSWSDAMMEGQFSAGSMAALDALHLLDGLDPESFTGLRRAARSCGWWWAHEAGVVFCERPAEISVSNGHLTVVYRDGWTVRT